MVRQLALAHAAGKRGLGAGDDGGVLAAWPSASTGFLLLVARAADLAGEMSAGSVDLLGFTPVPAPGVRISGQRQALVCVPGLGPLLRLSASAPQRLRLKPAGTLGTVRAERGDLSPGCQSCIPRVQSAPLHVRLPTLSSGTSHFIPRWPQLSALSERLCPGTWCFAPNFLPSLRST